MHPFQELMNEIHCAKIYIFDIRELFTEIGQVPRPPAQLPYEHHREYRRELNYKLADAKNSYEELKNHRDRTRLCTFPRFRRPVDGALPSEWRERLLKTMDSVVLCLGGHREKFIPGISTVEMNKMSDCIDELHKAHQTLYSLRPDTPEHLARYINTPIDPPLDLQLCQADKVKYARESIAEMLAEDADLPPMPDACEDTAEHLRRLSQWCTDAYPEALAATQTPAIPLLGTIGESVKSKAQTTPARALNKKISTPMTPADIAKTLKCPDKSEAIRKCLERLKGNGRLSDNDFIEVNNPRPRQAHILYYFDKVLPHLSKYSAKASD